MRDHWVWVIEGRFPICGGIESCLLRGGDKRSQSRGIARARILADELEDD